MLLKSPSIGFASAVIFLSAAIWGIYWVPLRYLEAQGVTGTAAIALLSLPAVLPLLLIVWRQWSQHRGYWLQTVLIGLFIGLGVALYSSGVVYSSVVRATLLFYLTPVWSTLIEIVWLKEKANWSRWLAVVAGLSGMALLLSGHDSVNLNIGDFLAFLAGITWAIGSAMIKRFDNVPLAGMTLIQFTSTVLAAVCIGYIMGEERHFNLEQVFAVLPTISMISIAIILPVVLAILWAQKFINPGRAGLLMMSEVVVAMVTASIFLPDERMTVLEWYGAALIISACLIEVLSTFQPRSVSLYRFRIKN